MKKASAVEREVIMRTCGTCLLSPIAELSRGDDRRLNIPRYLLSSFSGTLRLGRHVW